MKDKIILGGRPPYSIQIIKDRMKEVKHPDFKREYVWRFEDCYIGIKADISGSEDEWLINIYNKEEDIGLNNIDRQFKCKTINEALDSANRYVDRLNISKEEYAV